MEVEIKKKIYTEDLVEALNTIDDMLGNGDNELIEHTCREAALVITELVYQLRNVKEALETYTKPVKPGKMERKPDCFGSYYQDEWEDTPRVCGKCSLANECKEESRQ